MSRSVSRSVPEIAGMRVLVPGSAAVSAELVRLLDAAGAVPEGVPLIAIGPPDDLDALDDAVRALGARRYSWAGFTSVNAVDAVLRRTSHLGLSAALPTTTRVAAVGPATAAALDRAGVPVALQSLSGGAADLAKRWPVPDSEESRVLLPTSSIGLPTLADALQHKGYQVDRVTAYSTAVAMAPDTVLADLRAGRFGAVLLTSPSTAESLSGQTDLPPTTLVGCIGATTAAAAEGCGLSVHFCAPEATAAALVAELAAAATTTQRATQAAPQSATQPANEEVLR